MAILTVGCAKEVKVTGTVVQKGGKAVSDAKVVLSVWSPPVSKHTFIDISPERYFVLTDEEGKFRIEVKNPNLYREMDVEIVSKDNYRLYRDELKNGNYTFKLTRKIGDPGNGRLQFHGYEIFYISKEFTKGVIE